MLTYKAYSVPKINFSTRNFKNFLKNLVGIRFIYKLSNHSCKIICAETASIKGFKSLPFLL